MRRSGYRDFDPPKIAAQGHESSSIGFCVDIFLLFCCFLVSMHLAWLFYSKRREARRKGGEEQCCIQLYEMEGGKMLISRRKYRWMTNVDGADWLTGEYSLASFYEYGD